MKNRKHIIRWNNINGITIDILFKYIMINVVFESNGKEERYIRCTCEQTLTIEYPGISTSKWWDRLEFDT